MTETQARRHLLYQAAVVAAWTSGQRDYTIRLALRLRATQPIPEHVWAKLHEARDLAREAQPMLARQVIETILNETDGDN